VQAVESQPMFRRNMPPPSSGLKDRAKKENTMRQAASNHLLFILILLHLDEGRKLKQVFQAPTQ
jgi:hypothetical protein